MTSYDVAKAAGVSQSAVSRCYKPGGYVSDEMRTKVMKVARKLGFQPNAIARIMTTQRSNMVAVIINNSTNLCYPELLVQLSRRFDERGVHMLLFTREQEKDIDNVLDQVWQYQIDGVICAARLSHQQALFFEHRSIPLVFYNYYHRDFPASAICCDNEGGERILVDRLYSAGHRSFAIVSGHKDVLVNVDRTQGALARLNELGISDVAVYGGDNTHDSGCRAFRSLMQAGKGAPDALICANDAMAMGCMDVARYEFDLQIPEE
ncbi:MAG: LacI family DNA-binding transcriptional regulator, partial [Lysobacterales bacterium]